MRYKVVQSLVVIILLLILTTQTIQQTAKSHEGHSHTFPKISRKNTEFKSNKPRVKTLEAHIDDIVKIFKKNVLRLRRNAKLDLIFVIDASYSVELHNFKDEIRFVSRFVAGIPVSMNTTRVAVITFADNAQIWVDQVTADNIHDHKCSLLGTALPAITYASGSTYTLGGLEEAKAIMENARFDSKKVIFLITDGRSNGGDPRSVARRLRGEGIEIFTFGVHSGNVEELTFMASDPKKDHVYILKSFAEFESVARRALHADAEGGDYITEEDHFCNRYCDEQQNCCHSLGACRCGTTTGLYECVCGSGYFGFGLLPDGCTPCPEGTYKPHPAPGGIETCTPCPDSNMLSPNASSSLEQCICKRGYKKIDSECSVIRCPEISVPANGRFDGLGCDNKYKSTCRALCNKGYDLVGSDTIFCNIDGVWETNDGLPMQIPICQIRYCPPLGTPGRAKLNCTKHDSSFQTQCRFECEEGFALLGSESRNCQFDRQWDGLESHCERIRCSPPKPPIGGEISSKCRMEATSTLAYGETCRMSCPTGFALSVAEETTCIQIDRWSVDPVSAECIDIEPPSVVCPRDISVTGNPHMRATEVSWHVPTPSDNSDKVLLSATPAVNPPAAFPIGATVIEYQAVDGSGLVSRCNFTVTVEDDEPPIIDKCSDPEPFVIPRDETMARNLTWEVPTFSDNSGFVTLTRSHEFGDFPFGQTRVSYVASDATGNKRTCVITVGVQYDLCPPLEDPKYGHKVCRMNYEQLVECELVCDSKRYGMAQAQYGTPFYVCSIDGLWDPPHDIPMDCSHQRYSSEISKGFRVKYNLLTLNFCNDTDFIESVKIKFTNYFTPRVPIWCRTTITGIVCTLLSVEVQCIQEELPTPETPTISVHDSYGYGDAAGDDYFYGFYEQEQERKKRHTDSRYEHLLKRQKRQQRGDYIPDSDYSVHGNEPIPPDAAEDYPSYENNYADDDVPVEAAATEDISFSEAIDLPDEEILNVLGEDEEMLHKLEITINILGQVVLNDENVDESRKIHGSMSEYFGQLDVTREFTGVLNSVPVRHINTSVVEYVTYDSDSYTASHGELKCPLGAVLRESATCVNCPIGTYFDIVLTDCSSCQTGYYQDTEAQLSCKACPARTSTAGVHARSVEECKPLCNHGSYSSDGLEICIACPLHTFSDQLGATDCTPCPYDTGTSIKGATSRSQCGRLCEPGFAALGGIEPCYPCPESTYQFNSGSQYCYECPPGTNAAEKGSVSYTGCLGIDFLLPVRSPGPSFRSSPMFSEEDVLDLVVNSTRPFSDCFKDPCDNGECEATGAGYICRCEVGYTGENCEIDIDDCESSPCLNKATCTDLVNGFNCTCVDGYEGVTCSVETNECDALPCRNDATCVDQLAAFQCQCLDGYEGRLCETDINECITNPCMNGGMCQDLEARYECICQPGYTGSTCNADINDCEPEPCLNGGLCEDGINQFKCKCQLGFEGQNCEVNVDDCEEDICENGGSCLDLINAYRCICAPTFTGEHCSTELDPHFDLAFSKPKTYHHVAMQDGIRNMTEVTVAFYMQSNNTETSGTPFSYAVGKGVLADVLTLTNLEALTLYVNGEAIVTDSRKLNDGIWYHVVVTWKSAEGKWEIYLNSALEVEGSGLKPDTVIPGGGILVIGQEQDCLGGCFSASQEFIGTISQFNLYDYAMNSQQISHLFAHCVLNQGTVKAWPDALGGIVGQVRTIRPPTFCKPCTPIAPNNYLDVNQKNNYTNILQCDTGFKLRIRLRSGSSRRLANNAQLQCNNKGRWVFRQRVRKDPSTTFYCRRVRCRKFLEIAHGTTAATGQLYNDTVTYTCNEGFDRLGVEVIKCRANGAWSVHAPTCVDINECDNNPCHEMAACTNSHGSFHCVCHTGYTGDGILCTEINCGSPGVFNSSNANFVLQDSDDFVYGSHVNYFCDDGYLPSGQDKLFCQSNGLWNVSEDDLFHCNPVQCPTPDEVQNGDFHRNYLDTQEDLLYTFGQKINYECDEGFDLIGQAASSCEATGAWSSAPPICEPVHCGMPPDIAMATATLEHGPHKPGPHFLSRLTYICHNGYQLTNSSDETRICHSDATWTGSEPVCERVSCGPPPVVDNALAEKTTEVFEGITAYKCDEGFEMKGSAVLQCAATRQWFPEPPTCSRVTCPSPVVSDNVNFRANFIPDSEKLITVEEEEKLAQTFVFETTITFSCDVGYETTDSSLQAECQASSKWSRLSPICGKRDCGFPPLPDIHGTLQGESTTFQSEYIYSCDAGYYTIAPNITITCTSEGLWSTTSIPPCLPLDCGIPQSVRNGQIAGDDFTFPNSINYTCDQGYELFGPVILTCNADGEWDKPPPTCSPVDCGLLPEIEHGTLRVDSTLYQSLATYSCLDGYEMIGLETLECLWDSLWNEEPPECLPVDCGFVGELSNGFIFGTQQVYQSTVHFTCDRGYILYGDDNTTCMASALWSNPTPQCQPVDCGPPPFIANGEFVWDETTSIYKTTINYVCNVGYEFHQGKLTEIVCQAEGTWSESPQCFKVRCSNPFVPENGKMVGLSPLFYEYEDMVLYACDTGYIVHGDAVSTCTSSKTWDNPPSTCKPVDCGRLPDIAHGTKEGNNTLFMSTVVYECNSGYDIIGASVLECLYTGMWSDESPLCTPVICGDPPRLRNGNYSGGTTVMTQTFMDIVMYNCLEGYYLSGRSTAQCLADRSWGYVGENAAGGPTETGKPSCKRQMCQLPPVVTNGVTDMRNFTYGERVAYACEEGYEKPVLSNEMLLCTADKGDNEGYYVGSPPICSPVVCGLPPTTEHGYFVTRGLTYTDTASYTCDEGYYALGSMGIVCRSNRQWSDGPTCHPKDCGPPPELHKAFINITSTLFPSALQYNCDVGHALHGLGIVECLPSGNWSDTSNTSCDPVPCGSAPVVSNSTFFQTGNVYDDVVTYRCEPGFILLSTRDSIKITLKCQATGEWEEVNFSCQPKSCGPVFPVVHGTRTITEKSWSFSNFDSVHFPDVVRFSCLPGYRMNGNQKATCTTNGSFSSLAPTCPPVQCINPLTIENSVQTVSGSTFGHNITYVCNRGYAFRNDSGEFNQHVTECNEDGLWHPYPPTGSCERVICPTPASIPHGSIVMEDNDLPVIYKYTDSVTYQCDSGYEADPDTLSVMCKADKTWSDLPRCDPVSCGAHKCPKLATCSNTGTTFQHGGFVQCIAGYQFTPDVTRYEIICTERSRWESDFFNRSEVDIATCRRHSCGLPTMIDDGSYKLNNGNTKFESTATYECNAGYEIKQRKGETTVVCLSDKTWGPILAPACVRKDCGFVSCPEHATCVSDGTQYEATFHANCHSGYEISYDVTEVTLRCLESGRWSEIPNGNLQCLPVECTTPVSILHATITTENSENVLVYEEAVTYFCDEGYQMTGEATLVCQADRSYSSDSPACHPVPCGDPALIEHGIVDFSGTTYLQNATYHCVAGYTLNGDGEWRCSAGGSWISDDGGEGKSRPRHSYPETESSGNSRNDIFEQEPVHHQSAVSTLNEPNRISTTPSCDPVPCGPIPNIENGTPLSATATLVFNQSVSYICDDGFYLKGSTFLLCMEDGSFGPNSAPTCERLSCGEPPSLQHSSSRTVSVSGEPALNVYEDRVTYFCDRGYEFHSLHSNDELVCTEDGVWFPSTPDSCFPISCDPPPHSIHATTSGDEYTFNQVVTYECMDGYDLIGIPDLICLSTGKWSPEVPPFCAPVQCPWPSHVPHGYFVGNYSYQDVVTFFCDVGYELHATKSEDESDTIYCQSNRQWDLNPPRCVPVSCGEPPDINDGGYLGNLFTFGNEVVYSCDVGHEIKGDPVAICLSNRTWTSTQPSCLPVSCSHPPRVANSDYTFDISITFGNTVKYTCKEGYDLIGEGVITCTASRTFDFPPPTCVPVSCGEPRQPINGFIETTSGGTTFLHNITYVCNSGHEMYSGMVRKMASCTAGRVWSSESPICSPISCGPPPSSEHGSVEANSFSFSSVAAYSCDPGYELHGKGIKENCLENHTCLECRADGNWGTHDRLSHDEAPKCLPLSCGEPPNIGHGLITVDLLTYQSIAWYSCDTGRELFPESTTNLRCQADYTWGPDEPPVCRRIPCSKPAVIDHGFYSLVNNKTIEFISDGEDDRQYLFEDVVNFECTLGYRLTDPNEVTSLSCLSTGEWSNIAPTCKPVPCGRPPSRRHGSLMPLFIGRSFTFMDVITYQCNEGHEWNGLESEETLTCTHNGRWSMPEPPACDPVSCGMEPHVENGLAMHLEGGVLGRLTYRSVVRYECFHGYYMIGKDEVTCQSNKSWSILPSCLPVSCNIAPAVLHGTVSHYAPAFHTEVLAPSSESDSSSEHDIFHSSGDLMLYTGEVSSLQEKSHLVNSEHKLLTKESSEIIPPIVPPLTDDNSAESHKNRKARSVSKSNSVESHSPSYVFGDAVQYACDPGYMLNFSLPHSLRCGPNGLWSTPSPLCDPIPCDPLPSLQNARQIGRKFTFGEEVIYICDEGYQFSDSAPTRFACNENGMFLPVEDSLPFQLPTCSRVSCGFALNVPNSALVEGNLWFEVLFEDVIRYVCLDGYIIHGESTLLCQANGLFDNLPPACEPIDCGQPIPLRNTAVNVTTTTFGNVATYRCIEGYVEDSGRSTCRADGNWSPTDLSCVRVDCGIPPSLDFGLFDLNGTKYNDVATYHCYPGYNESGTFFRTCLASGNWSDTCQKCTPVDCGQLDDPVNGFYLAQGNFTYGNTILYYCNEGYELIGSIFSMCNAFGHWSDIPPDCERRSCGYSPTVDQSTRPSVVMHYGDEITYDCVFGHVLNGVDTLECTSDGTFNHEPPSCDPRPCDDLPSVRNAHLVSDADYVFGVSADFECDKGYEFFFDPIPVYCTGFGTFEDSSALGCNPVECPFLDDIAHGSLSRFTGSFNESVAYTCDNGYHIEGESIITCNENASWSPAPPRCQPNQCGPAPVYPNAHVINEQDVYTFQMEAEYECNEGYEFPPINGETHFCEANGAFSGGDVTCRPVSCVENTPILNAIFTNNGITYLKEGNLMCDNGYQLSTGEEEIHLTCQANRLWSRDISEVTCDPVSCDPLPVVSHSHVEVKGEADFTNFNGNSDPLNTSLHLHFGQSVSYTCDSGYYINGSSDISCLTDGSWDDPTPSCLPVNCGKPPYIANARTADINHTFGMSASYNCVTGHISSSEARMTRTCQADGLFSDNQIVCERIPCSNVPAVEHGTPSATSAVYNEIVSYHCYEGYEIDGNETIRCGSSGEWTSSPPLCSPVQCGAPHNIDHSYIVLDGSSFQDKGVLHCNMGFEFDNGENNITFTCQANTSWTSNLSDAKCNPIHCEYISGISNGAIVVIPPTHRIKEVSSDHSQGNSHTFGTRLFFNCNAGYTLGGPTSIRCEADKMWSDMPPSCEAVECHQPADVPNALLTTERHTFGKKAIYECIDGYILSSTGNFRICNENSSYSNHPVTCSPRSCPAPPALMHGRVITPTDSPVFGDVASARCDVGYVLRGIDIFECLASGQWSEAEPTCEPLVCGLAPVVARASPIDVVCAATNRSFRGWLTPPPKKNKDPTCVTLYSQDPSYKYSYGEVVSYECEIGHVLQSENNVIVCGPDGYFEESIIDCEPIVCPELPKPQHGIVSGTRRSFGNKMKIVCDVGYEIKSKKQTETSLVCMHTGQWSEDPASINCTGIDCEPLLPLTSGRLEFQEETVNNSRLESLILTYPSSIMYRCDHGYILLGISKRFCLTDGRWTGHTPYCQPVDCGLLPRFINGAISVSTTTLGSTAHYKCNIGYSLDPPESATRRCKVTGSWSGTSPLCKLINCSRHPAVKQGELSTTETVFYGSTVEITCDKGYLLEGNASRTCSTSGTFDGSLPTCTPVNCGLHPFVEGGVVKPDGASTYQESVNITCEEGFKLEYGDDYRVCQDTGEWSGELPICGFEEELGQPAADFIYGFPQQPLPCGRPIVRGTKVKLANDEELEDYYEPESVLTFCCKNGYLPRGDLTVRCIDGSWTGEPECLSRCKHRCLNSGVCSSGSVCSCRNGWTGSRCNRPTCSLPCLNGGYCVAPFQCKCAAGWTGSRCQTAKCNPSCENGGVCIAPNQCNCPYGYYGSDCSLSYFSDLW